MSQKNAAPRLFQGYGIELEYMIVHRDTLDIFPCADKLLHDVSGTDEGEIRVDSIGWSNELVLHVVEIKTIGPVKSLAELHLLLQKHVDHINERLLSYDACLMPSAMHPWMDPTTQTRLWPHGNHEIYETYDRIFGCRGHGWANLQSAHLNLAFRGDDEFARLHAAVRLVLPIIPAIAASSPVLEGRLSGLLDTRLDYYGKNQKRVPIISGKIIPENVLSAKEYQHLVLEKIYRDIAPYDPHKILQYEWLNSRGAIPRFNRSAIEVRLIDVQECPKADLAIAFAITAALKALVNEKWSTREDQGKLTEDRLRSILAETIRSGESAVITDELFLTQFGCERPKITAGELWSMINQNSWPDLGRMGPDLYEALAVIFENGTLARRISKALGNDFSKKNLRNVYGKLCSCLSAGELFGD